MLRTGPRHESRHVRHSLSTQKGSELGELDAWWMRIRRTVLCVYTYRMFRGQWGLVWLALVALVAW